MNSENKFHHPQRNLGQNFKLSEAPNPPHFIAAETCWGKANRVSLKAKTIDQHLFNFSARYPLDIKSEGHSLISRLLILLQILLFRPFPPPPFIVLTGWVISLSTNSNSRSYIPILV